MKKVIIITLIILFILFGSGIIYLNNVLLPKTIKALMIKAIEEKIGSRVSLGSLKVNIFKGLVLRDLNIYRNGSTLLSVKEASCILLPFPVLQKKIIIPSITLKSAHIFLERKQDGVFNLQDLSPPQVVNPGAPGHVFKPSSKAKGFTVVLYRLNIYGSTVTFQDSTFNPPFIKNIEDLDLTCYLTLPVALKFKLSGRLADSQVLNLNASGEFNIPSRELSAKVSLQDISPREFAVYYQGTGLNILSGRMDSSLNLKTKNDKVYADLQAQGKELKIIWQKTSVQSNLALNAILEYGLSDKQLKYSGNATVSGGVIVGLEFVQKISAINAGINFNNQGLSTDNLAADIFGFPVKARVELRNFSDPVFGIKATSDLELSRLPPLLKDKFNFDLPGVITGQASLYLAAEGKLNNLELNGSLSLVNATLKLKQLDAPLQEINGKLVLSKENIQWQGLKLKYKDMPFTTSGTLSGMLKPLLDITVKSGDLLLVSSLAFDNKLIKITRCSGNYLASKFSLSGSIDVSDASAPRVNLKGDLLVELQDLKQPLAKFNEVLDKLKPEGKVKAQFNLSGDIHELKGCVIEATLSSEGICLYGLKGKDFLLNYIQSAGIASVPLAHLSLYSGALDFSFKANLGARNEPYAFDAQLQGVKIEELKLDTLAKSKDIAGIIQAELKVNGFLGDLQNSKGLGRISITKGKFWELDLFKGMGKLLFSQDFANIIFSEGSCTFAILDKYISTDMLTLKSNMVLLSGPVRIGFDSSINAALDVNILDELVPLSGTFKDVTTAILGQTGNFAVIKISGTLKEPKYKVVASVTDILKGLANTFLKKL